jgi:hypothetical protein
MTEEGAVPALVGGPDRGTRGDNPTHTNSRPGTGLPQRLILPPVIERASFLSNGARPGTMNPCGRDPIMMEQQGSRTGPQ